jgi:hypothetical protein
MSPSLAGSYSSKINSVPTILSLVLPDEDWDETLPFEVATAQ